MMNDEAVHQLEEGFRKQHEFIENSNFSNKDAWLAQLRDCVIMVATVVNQECRFYDMREFYRRSGYTGAIPVHNN